MRFLISLSGLIILLVSCRSDNPVVVSPQTEENSQTLVAQNTPELLSPTSTIEPPAENEAVLSGVLIFPGDENYTRQPYRDLHLFLGVILTGNNGNASVARVNQNTAPFAITDVNGRFIFSGVEPGEYILVARLPPNNLVMLKDPDTGTDMLVTLRGGELKDLGLLNYDFGQSVLLK